MALVINTNGLLAGMKPQIEIASWVTAYAGTPYYDLGCLKDVSFDHELTTNVIEADNVLAELGAFDSKEKATLKGKLIEFDLKNMARLSGGAADGSDAAVVSWVDDTTDGTVTWGRGTPGAAVYFNVKLTLWTPSLTYTWGGNTGTDTYTSAVLWLAKCKAKVKTSEAYKKNGVWELPFELECFHDSGCTSGQELFKWVLTKAK